MIKTRSINLSATEIRSMRSSYRAITRKEDRGADLTAEERETKLDALRVLGRAMSDYRQRVYEIGRIGDDDNLYTVDDLKLRERLGQSRPERIEVFAPHTEKTLGKPMMLFAVSAGLL
jgi:hypothetical protein